MTKTERARLTAQENALVTLGFTTDEADTLRRISRTLRRWHEAECGNEYGAVERDEVTGRPMFVTQGAKGPRRYPVRDMEAGALRRLARIMRAVNERRFVGDAASVLDARCDDLTPYIQTDPRGAALYILRPGDVPPGSKAESCYTNGICVY